MKKVTGIGGVFFKVKDPAALKTWYDQHLGFNTDQWGQMFKFRTVEDPSKVGNLQWSPFKEDTDYFNPSEKQWMINYRVDDLEGLVKELKSSGVTVVDEIETYDYGKFVHIMDLEGNKIELWEPVDEGFGDTVE
ncbi:MAG: VOC family protein [Bacteroidota bacterium]